MTKPALHDVIGWRCRVCDATVELADPTPWRCPNATATDRHHVLDAMSVRGDERRRVSQQRGGEDRERPIRAAVEPNPFVRYDHRLAWAAAAASQGMELADRRSMVRGLDDAVRAVDGVGFVTTPFARSDALSDALGFDAGGGVWVKDETGGVAGSQKARHLFTILLHLRAMEELGTRRERSRLAIASCGNAALAAATLAKAAAWPIDVYVPTWMGDGFGDRLDELGAAVHRCARRRTDPPADPAMLRFREAVTEGAVPFTVQGPENALCLDGGRTIGWEIAEQVVAPDGPGRLDKVFVQVGGGAFATCLGRGLAEGGCDAALMATQAEGCAPFERAMRRATGQDQPGRSWSAVMTPWEHPASRADGILDDETYDWLGVLDVVRRSGGAAVVASERNIVRAHELAHAAGFDASATGTAGLAGLLEVRLGDEDGAPEQIVNPRARIGIVMSGVTR